MKLKKSHLLTVIVSFIIFMILFYPHILPIIDIRSVSPVIIESSQK